MSVINPKLVEIYRARNLPEAYVIRAALDEVGVKSHVENEFLQGAVGELPAGWITCPRIHVDESQANLAMEIINQAQLNHLNRSESDEDNRFTRCLSCGFIMGQSDARCSSCGWTYLSDE
ncbi:MAG: DUF2007 domain-containing protein [Schlesneria sp.]